MIIYKITNRITHKIYIGQTVQTLNARWRDHVRGDKQPEGYLHRSIQKYGPDNFEVELIDSALTLDGLNALEEFYIKKFNTIAPFGYNLLQGGKNRKLYEDTKKKLSILNKGKTIPNRWTGGNTQSPSEETRAKISEALKGRPITNRWTGGNTTPRTEEQKQFMRSLRSGVSNAALFKAVICVETGKVYESVNAVAKAFKINRVTISGLIKTGKKGRMGYSFKFT